MGSSNWICFLFNFEFRWFRKCLAISLFSSKKWWRFVSLDWREKNLHWCLGAFLIPYFILYFLIGAPLYFLELALGQFTSRGPGTGFKMARGWQGHCQSSIFDVFHSSHLLFRRWYSDDYQQCFGNSLLQCYHCLGTFLFYFIVSQNSLVDRMRKLVEFTAMFRTGVTRQFV